MTPNQPNKPKRADTTLKSWRCFHCDEVFDCPSEAAEHFGPTQKSVPKCQVSRKYLESIAIQLRKYQEEDTELHREIADMGCELQIKLRRAEEEGYAKGLRDGTPAPPAKKWTAEELFHLCWPNHKWPIETTLDEEWIFQRLADAINKGND